MPEGQVKSGSGRPWRLWVWRNFRIKVPDDWEMLQFSRKISAGNCTFADRYQYRLEFSWNRFSCKSAEARPDIKRLVSDYCAKLKLQGQMPDVRPTESGGWRGLVGHAGRTLTTRFGGYYSSESCVVELVFTWPGGRDSALERAVLKSVKEEVVHENGFRRWKAFGMDMLVSGGLQLGHCKVEPANVTMEFTHPSAAAYQDTAGLVVHRNKHRRQARQQPVPSKVGTGEIMRERFQRVGMVSQWLRLPVGEWLEGSVPQELKERSHARRTVSGHEIEAIRGLMPTKGMSRLSNLVRLTNRRNLLGAAAWLCPADGRLYCCRVDRRMTGVQEGNVPGDRDALDLAGGRLSCCAL